MLSHSHAHMHQFVFFSNCATGTVTWRQRWSECFVFCVLSPEEENLCQPGASVLTLPLCSPLFLSVSAVSGQGLPAASPGPDCDQRLGPDLSVSENRPRQNPLQQEYAEYRQTPRIPKAWTVQKETQQDQHLKFALHVEGAVGGVFVLKTYDVLFYLPHQRSTMDLHVFIETQHCKNQKKEELKFLKQDHDVWTIWSTAPDRRTLLVICFEVFLHRVL